MFCTALALVLGLGIGWLDLHTTEVAVTIMPLLAAGLMLGLMRPVAAWRWPVLEVVGLPAMSAVARMIGAETAEPAQLDIRIIVVALVFALIGSYTGVLIRKSLRSSKTS